MELVKLLGKWCELLIGIISMVYNACFVFVVIFGDVTLLQLQILSLAYIFTATIPMKIKYKNELQEQREDYIGRIAQLVKSGRTLNPQPVVGSSPTTTSNLQGNLGAE